MSPAVAADATPVGPFSKITDNHSSDMVDDESLDQGEGHKQSYDNDDNEDPATQAASENLKHASISEKEPSEAIEPSFNNGSGSTASEKLKEEPTRPTTPEPLDPSEAQDEEMRERISSPKKKRGREQDDEVRDLEAAGSIEEDGSSPNGSAVNGGRTTRLAPEKKRHRDASVDTVVAADTAIDTKDSHIHEPIDVVKAVTTSVSETSKTLPEISSRPAFDSSSKDKVQTSASAFANSGFSSLAASSTSGFAALVASKPTVFGSGAALQLSGFGAIASASPMIPDTSTIKSGFGGKMTQPLGSTLASGFGNISQSGFGALGGGFSGSFAGFTGGSGPKLSSFAASGSPDIVGVEKPAKAFGAPESDEEVDDDDDDESRGGPTSDEDEIVSVDDKKKHKVGRVLINDGEEGEATLLQFRAKLFTFVSKETGWKERGVGILKLNVPRTFVDYDEHGIPIPGSFDPSARDDSDDEESEPAPTVARLIMRQENTHRVILNTVILKALKFEEKSSGSGAQILFTAFEDAKPVNMLLRANEVNARHFISEIQSIQKEL